MNTTMQGSRVQPIVTASIDGPVPALDRSYAFDELRKLSDSAAKPVCRAHARFFCDPTTHPRPVAIAECAVILEGSSKVVVAGAVGATMRDAVDELTARLRRRFRDIARRDREQFGRHPGENQGGIRHDQYR